MNRESDNTNSAVEASNEQGVAEQAWKEIGNNAAWGAMSALTDAAGLLPKLDIMMGEPKAGQSDKFAAELALVGAAKGAKSAAEFESAGTHKGALSAAEKAAAGAAKGALGGLKNESVKPGDDGSAVPQNKDKGALGNSDDSGTTRPNEAPAKPRADESSSGALKGLQDQIPSKPGSLGVVRGTTPDSNGSLGGARDKATDRPGPLGGLRDNVSPKPPADETLER